MNIKEILKPSRAYNRTNHEFEVELDATFDNLSNLIKAGYSLEVAFKKVLKHTINNTDLPNTIDASLQINNFTMTTPNDQNEYLYNIRREMVAYQPSDDRQLEAQLHNIYQNFVKKLSSGNSFEASFKEIIKDINFTDNNEYRFN